VIERGAKAPDDERGLLDESAVTDDGIEQCSRCSAGSGEQADARQFSVGLLLVFRESGHGSGDLPPRLLALSSVKLLGGHWPA
jgi:hypothetical protein